MKIKYYHILIPDMHVPYHNEKALDAVLKFANDIRSKLHTFCIKGDFYDFVSLSQHGVKNPRLHTLLIDELQEGLCVFDYIHEKVKKISKKRVFIQGNHEYRFERFVRNKAVELTSLVSLEDYLFRGERKDQWEYAPYTKNQLYMLEGTTLGIRHEPYGSSTQASIKNGMIDLNHGHDHRIHKTILKNASGRYIEASSDGWLGDHKSPAVDYLKKFSTWSEGFGLVAVTDTSWFHTTIQIKEDHFVALGKVYEL